MERLKRHFPAQKCPLTLAGLIEEAMEFRKGQFPGQNPVLRAGIPCKVDMKALKIR
jgi:hypothetical protein